MATENKQPTSKGSEKNLMEMTCGLLKTGDEKIKLLNQRKNLVLVLGDTGNGKSIFTKWIAGQNKILKSVETIKDSGDYVIINTDETNNSTITSNTIYPTLVVDTETKVAYYDCPGFDDTRHTSNDIATTFFIKKIVDFADSVKIIFVINYPSVRVGVDRHNFMKLMRHATEFIKDVDKYGNSVALVATKVDNTRINNGAILVDDSKVVKNIAHFLLEVIRELKVRKNDPSETDKSFLNKAIKLSSYFLKSDGEQYTRIGIFRRPEQPGPVSEMPILRKGKSNIQRIINQNLKFTTKAEDDFGYTISERSKNGILCIVEEINKRVWQYLVQISDEIAHYFRSLIKDIRKTIAAFDNVDSLTDPDSVFADKLYHSLIKGNQSVLILTEQIRIVTSPFELAQILKLFLTDLEIGLSGTFVSDIENLGKYFNFLQTVSRDGLFTRSWDELFRSMQAFMSKFLAKLQESADENIPKTLEHISSSFDIVAADIQSQLDVKLKLMGISEIIKTLRNHHNPVLQLVEKSESVGSIKEYLKIVHQVARCMKINVPSDSAVKILKLAKILEFWQTCKKTDCKTPSSIYVQALRNILKYIDEKKNWYVFLDFLYGKLSEYEIQKIRSMCDTPANEVRLQPEVLRDIALKEMGFQQFLQSFLPFNDEELENIGSITMTEIVQSLTESRREEFDKLLKLTLDQQINLKITLPSLFINGDYILLSDIIKKFRSMPDFKSGSIEIVYIFALRTVFIDEDVSLPGVGLRIIAPKWEIIGERKINLNGFDGVPHSPSKADNGSEPGRDGKDGRPGMPGEPGGTFFGIGETFANGASLTITANGGDGGSGQDGGDGTDGQDGSDAEVPTSVASLSVGEIEKGISNIGGYSCEKIGGDRDDSDFRFLQLLFKRNFYAEYKTFGRSGVEGGNGGNGGIGGKGGNPGVVVLCELEVESGISKSVAKGKCGRKGYGGAGGKGGRLGKHIIARCDMYRPFPLFWLFISESSKWTCKEVLEEDLCADAGKRGADGGNDNGSLPPRPENCISEPFKIVNMYKKYSLEKMACRYKRSSLLSFFNKMDEKRDIQNVYNTIGLMEEFQMMEEEHPRSPLMQSHFAPFYRSMLNKVSEHAKQSKNSEDLKVLQYLYTAILSKISIISDDSRRDLVVDIGRYLDMIKSDIESLKDSQENLKISFYIEKQAEDYKSSVTQKIEEAKSLITTHILPEVGSIRSEMSYKIRLLQREMTDLKNDAKCGEKLLNMKRRELERSLSMKKTFFELIADAQSFLFHVGPLIVSAIETAASVGNSLDANLEPSKNFCVLNKIVNKVASAVSMGESLDANLEPSKNVGVLNKIYNKAASAVSVGESLDANLEPSKNFGVLKAIYNKGAECVQSVLSNQKDELFALNAAIDHADKKFTHLKSWKEKIYDSMSPLLNNLEGNLSAATNEIDSMSRITLDVKKWQVLNSLKNFQFKMQELTRGFKAQDNIARCFDMLQESMTIIFKVYDHIESYREQQILADCITNLSSVQVKNVKVCDQKLVNALNHLDTVLKYNLLLKHYKTALDAFNQWVFPFSQNYVADFVLPHSFKLDRSIEDLVSESIAQVEQLKSNVEDYKMLVKKSDKSVHHGEFNSRNCSTESFFVWKNDQHKGLISRLLSGEEIVLKADVKKSPLHKDAIKFSCIEFNLVCKNEAMQSELNRILRGFDVMAIHTGNSYYRFAKKIYLIASDKQTISYSFEKNSKGENVRTNVTYNKIKKGDLLLSPYTVWHLKLVAATSRSFFHNLKNFGSDIDIELAGHGSFVMNYDQINLADEDYTVVEERNELDQYLD